MATARNSPPVRRPRISRLRFGSASVHLSRISERTVSPQEAQQVLTAAFTAPDYIECIKNLTVWEINPQAYIDGLDQVCSRPLVLITSTLTTAPHQIIDTLAPGSEIYKCSLRALIKVCGIYGILPSSHLVPPGLTLTTKRPFASGGFSDVWKARNDSGQVFSVKKLRTYEAVDLGQVKKVLRVFHSACQYFSLEPCHQKYYKDVVTCRRVRHENVLSVEGIAPGLFELCIVLKWMNNGNMLHYMRAQGQADRMSLVNASLCGGVSTHTHCWCSVAWYHAWT